MPLETMNTTGNPALDEQLERMLRRLSELESKLAGAAITPTQVPAEGFAPYALEDPTTTKGDIIVRPSAEGPVTRQPVGSDTQVLIADSTTSTGIKWGAASSYVNPMDIMTTKGDLLTRDTGYARLGVGSNGQVITADSTAAKGIKWAAVGPDVLTTKGDLLGWGSAYGRLGVGSNGQVLMADSAQTLGIKWATPSVSGAPSYDVAMLSGNVLLVSDPTKIYVRISDQVILDPTVTLPDPTTHTGVPIILEARNTNSHAMTIARHGSEKIDGVAASYSMNTTGPRLVTLISNGTDWYVIGSEL